MGSKRSKGSTLDAVETSAIIILVMFAMFYVSIYLRVYFGREINYLGILPRSLPGLVGIAFSPLLHYNLAHLTANTISLFLLLVFLYSHREYKADHALLSIWVLSGIGTWIIGRPALHIGASSLVYGLVLYLLTAAWWLRSWRSMFIAIFVLFFYGGIFYGVLPQPGIVSWEGHLSGAIAGFVTARHQHS